MSKGHAVVDGSNLATEGRSDPSLAQLRDAIAAFEADHDFAHVTVVVDASFEHRVAKKERAAVERAIDEGQIITPPAGAVGRGDAFILQIAGRAGAVVVSNDSFQEFHGQHSWLFDEGRLIGGKPVDHVGWVFVARTPVRGPTSREAVRKAKSDLETPSAKKKSPAPSKQAKKAKRVASSAANAPARAKKAAEAKKSATKATDAKKSAKKATEARKSATKVNKSAPRAKKEAKPTKPVAKTDAKANPARPKSRTDGENPVRAWQKFRRDHPVGAVVEATVERFSSHGAYAVTSDGLTAYVPLRLMADPPPTRARDIITIGDRLELIVHSYDADRRSIDLGLLPVDGRQSTGATKPAVPPTTRQSNQQNGKVKKRSATKTQAN